MPSTVLQTGLWVPALLGSQCASYMLASLIRHPTFHFTQYRWQQNGFINAKGLPVANKDLIHDIMEVRRAHDGKVRLQYVPGHSGNYGNEQADW